MQFYESHFLSLLWLTPILFLLFIASGWLAQKRMRALLKTAEIQEKLLPHYEKSEWPIRAVLLLLAFIFSVIALSQPQWGEEKKKIERKGVDLIFMLDVSTSMLAEDIKPSRVQKVKFEIESFVKSLKGDRIGMLAFAGSSFMQTPLTLDYSAFLIFLEGVDVGHVPDPGTAMGPAIQKAIEAFPDEKGKYRAIVIFSDGEDHEMQIDRALELAKQKNVRIYTVGAATVEGAPIPLKNESGAQTAVKKDRAGAIVITKLNRELLEKVASETGGIYLPVTPGENEINIILRHLSSLGVKKIEDRIVTEKEDHYQIFIFMALLCLMLEMLVRRGKSQRMLPISALAFVFILNCGFIPTPQNKVEDGNQDFEGKRYQSAIQKYREVQVKNPDSPPVEYNLATSLYKVDQYQESAAHLKNAVEKSSKDPELQAKAAYNYGNALYRSGDYEGALEAYKKSLELNPKDEDAKYNIEFITNKKSNFEKENNDRKKDNPNKKDDKNKQKNNQNQQQNQKNEQQNQSGGGSQNKDKQQGQDNKDQQGSGKQNQDKNQNEGGQGQDQKNDGQGKNDQDQKKDNQNSGGSGQKDQPQDQQNKGENKKGQGNQGQDQKQQDQKQGSGQNDQPQDQQDKGKDKEDKQNKGGEGKDKQDEQQQQGSGKEQKNDQGQGKNEPKDQPQGQGNGNQPRNQGEKPPSDQQQAPKPDQGKGSQNKSSDQQPKQDQQAGGGTGAQQGEKQKDDKNQGTASAGGQALQGQMNKKDAENLLASLEDSEKKFRVMRKPTQKEATQVYVEKDW